MDDRIFDTGDDGTALPRLREPTELTEYTPSNDTPEQFLSSCERRFPKEKSNSVPRLISAVLSVIFCTTALIFYGMGVYRLAQQSTREKAGALMTREVFSLLFALETEKAPEETVKPQAQDSASAEDTGDAEQSDDTFPIEKTDLSASENNRFSLNNQTRFSVNSKELLEKERPLPTASEIYTQYGKNAPVVLIMHTHGTEAYSETEDSYTAEGPFRSNDTSKNVVAIGEIMTSVLEEAGINTLHDREMYDRESYRDSYERSRNAAAEHLEGYPSITYVFDVHRDAVIQEDKTALCPVGLFGELETAQAMLVVGTDQDGADHENWRTNLTLALQVQRQLCNNCDSVARRINLRSSAFNQGLSSGSLLLEIGSFGNTLLQAKRCAVICAYSLAELINGAPLSVSLQTLVEKYAAG